MADPDSETHQLADALDTAIAGLVDCDGKEAVGLYFRKQLPAVQKNAKFIAACKTASA
jgi:hypothetical protein